MGMTKVKMKVKSPKYPQRVFEGKFLVDSGAIFTVVPSEVLKKLGIKAKGEEEFVLADGKMISRKVGHALYEYQGKERAAPVMFGEMGDSLLLGVFKLEALGLSLDSLKRELYKATLRI